MAETPWAEVDAYVSALLAPHNEVLEAALKTSAEAGLPEIQVSAPQGKLLQILARSIDAQTILEFGTLGGYSTIWLAQGLGDDGRLITLEADARYAEVARSNLVAAGLADIVDLRVGPAAGARGRRRRPVRSGLHRCRQGEHARLLPLGAGAHARRRHDRRRPRR